ncbi:hypothetical protein [Streptomyces sp. AK02-01A]|uniref:hypothetical protein n=1 Tax=Streptomyces sp. AK02-01A TaxID=3028648 RepID=UPI0029AA7F20|nr:hypothetical protein [Streptomyces sp. AK02-01A]MDX3852143.1 hypothetical protein [Streptomyces sp. AK02-01A]
MGREGGQQREICAGPGKGGARASGSSPICGAAAGAGKADIAGGPFLDGGGASFSYEVDSLGEAEEIVAADPYTQSGTCASRDPELWEIAGSRPDPLSTG